MAQTVIFVTLEEEHCAFDVRSDFSVALSEKNWLSAMFLLADSISSPPGENDDTTFFFGVH